jgi:hypothetical protein
MLQNMWNQMGFQLPGMVTPTLDEGELDKQIRDLRSVENWLRMNLSMLQMTIQNLEVQKSALGTFRSMSAHFTTQPTETPAQPATRNPFFQAMNTSAEPPTPEPQSEIPTDEAALAKAAMWPWEMMNELNATVQAQLADANRKQPRKAATKKSPAKAPAKKKAAAKRKPAAKQ